MFSLSHKLEITPRPQPLIFSQIQECEEYKSNKDWHILWQREIF